MMGSLPLVSIGMPVFNEDRFIEKSLDALVNQDHTNIEMIVSDNASEDKTGEICRKYAEQYDWISYHKFNTNVGIAENFSFTLQEARGKYFMWASGHDLWTSNYISACVNLLESCPAAMVAFGISNWIDQHDAVLEREYGWIDTRGMDVIARYFAVLWGNMHPIYGLHRRDALFEIPIKPVVGTDLIVLAQLALKGDFVNAVDAIWSRRESHADETYKDKINRYKSSDYMLTISRVDKLLPLLKLPVELGKGVLTADLPLSVRMAILFLLIASFPVKYYSGIRNR